MCSIDKENQYKRIYAKKNYGQCSVLKAVLIGFHCIDGHNSTYSYLHDLLKAKMGAKSRKII